jgi:hypothetical protein
LAPPDPVLDRFAVLRRYQLERDQHVGLRQHMLVQRRRALGNRDHPKALGTAEADGTIDLSE